MESWTSQRMRGNDGKRWSKFCFLNGNFHFFSSVSPDILMWKRERSFSFLFLRGFLEILLCQSRSKDKSLKSNKTEKRQLCVAFCAFLPLAESSNGSYINIPANPAIVTITKNSWQKNKFLGLMKDVVFIWFWLIIKHKHFMCDL